MKGISEDVMRQVFISMLDLSWEYLVFPVSFSDNSEFMTTYMLIGCIIYMNKTFLPHFVQIRLLMCRQVVGNTGLTKFNAVSGFNIILIKPFTSPFRLSRL